MRVVSACFWGLLLFLTFNIPSILAHTDFDLPTPTEGQVTEALEKTVPLRFLPSHPLYFLITTKETLSRFFKPSAKDRAQFDLVLSGKRLKEAYLLLSNDKVNLSGKSLARYGKRIEAMVKQLEKAKGQNQDIENLLGEVADILKHHEILLSTIAARWQEKEDSPQFDENLNNAVSIFAETVKALDRLKPGVKDRFQITRDSVKEEVTPLPVPPEVTGEATPTKGPRRIIY